MSSERFTLTHVEGRLWVAVAPTGLGKYDFDFESAFACTHPFRLDGPVIAIARMGAADDYAARFAELAGRGVRLVHDPAAYERTSDLRVWHPLIADLTPESVVYDQRPAAADVAKRFGGWPVFVKGVRQTSRHQRRLSVIESASQFEAAMDEWRVDPILRWQPIVCRRMLDLRPVAAPATHVIQPSFEFRTFWWRGACVGFGPYWTADDYAATDRERADAIAIAGEAARRIDVPFLVVDVAQDRVRRWHVIEVNDGQDSGYAGVNRRQMWRRIVDAS